MVKRREIGLALVLTIITCGIYGIYWFIVLTNDIAELSGDRSFSGGMAFLLSLVTCGIYTIFWAYKVGKLIAEAQARRGMYVTDNSVMFVLLSIFGFGIVAYAIAQSDVNKMATH